MIWEYAPSIEDLRAQGEFIVDIGTNDLMPQIELPLTDDGQGVDWDRYWEESGLPYELSKQGATMPRVAPVSAFTIVRPSAEAEELVDILIAVRAAGDANKTHQNVISVPTQRGLYYHWHGAVRQGVVNEVLYDESGIAYGVLFEPEEHITSYFDETSEAVEDSRSETVRFALSTKIDWPQESRPDRLDSRLWSRRNFVVAGGAFVLGNSQIDYNPYTEITVVERIAMNNIIVGVDQQTIFPKANRHYSMIGWVGLNRFIELVKTKDVFSVSDVFEKQIDFDMCVHGVCMASTSAILSQAGIYKVAGSVLDSIENKPEQLIYRGQVC